MIVGNPESKRVALFQAALARFGLSPATVVAYADLLAGRETLERVVNAGTVVRIESPGQNFEVEKALLAVGAEVAEEQDGPRISREDVQQLTFDKGRILSPRQWYLGFREILRRLERQLASCPAHRAMNRPADIAILFDKCRCQDLLARHGLPVPRGLGPVRSYDELRERIKQTGRCRVFVKLAHGSSASGVVAYETNGPREQAFTTVEMVRHNGELRLYNSRRIRRYRDHAEIAVLIDALCRERVQVEEWVPKAGLDEQSFDLRIVVIAGQAKHAVVRLSRTPLTNLHLKNQRGDLATLIARMGQETWETARHTCERVAAVFPGSLHVGVDLVIAPGYRRHAVLEVNAFGDLLPGITCDGMDTYAAEIAALLSLVSACSTSTP